MSVLLTVELDGFAYTVHQIYAITELPNGFARLYSGSIAEPFHETMAKHLRDYGEPTAFYLHIDSQECWKLFCFQGEMRIPVAYHQEWLRIRSQP